MAGDRIAPLQRIEIPKADGATREEQPRAETVADEATGGADDVVAAKAERKHVSAVTRVSRAVDYTFYLLYGLIGLEINLELLRTSRWGGLKRFVDAVAIPILGPFHGIVPDFSVGSLQVPLSYILALAAYLMLHLALHGLLRLFAYGKKGTMTLGAWRSTPSTP
jgi:hypothetical protein